MTKRRLAVAAAAILVLIYGLGEPANAHPGRTAADGCHYCRTNCDRWGVLWNERHCHGGGIPLPQQPPKYIPTPSPSPSPKSAVTPGVKGESLRVPNVTPSPSPSPTTEPSPSFSPSPSPTLFPTALPLSSNSTRSNDGSGAGWVIGLGSIAALGTAVYLARRKRRSTIV